MKQNKQDLTGFLLSRSTNLIWKHLTRNFAKAGYDITPEQYSILLKLNSKNNLSQKEVAEATSKDKVSITKIVNSLEKRNLVKRISDNGDRRIKRISLTNKAKRILPKLNESANETLNTALRNMDKKELETFKLVLRNIQLNLSI
jgi:DNA-binding MarR family transcriptional regulator